MKFRIVSLLLPLFLVSACQITTDDDEKEGEVYSFEFENSENWQAGFADYPVGGEVLYELVSGIGNLPAPLSGLRGFRLSGNNHSDDLFMYVKKSVDGLKPNTRYRVRFEALLATNAQAGCAGVGGAPGESVAVKAGVSLQEPDTDVDGDGYYRMNISKGQQFEEGSNAVVLGTMANSQECGTKPPQYELKRLDNAGNSLAVTTSDSGEVWVLFGTDSGYESTTDMYWESAEVVFVEQ